MKRQIIKIDEEKCNGCGDCVPNCPEGAIQIIDGKARLVDELLCDGLGACIGHCPEGAITIEKREAETYDEGKVMENIIKQGDKAVQDHIKHLKDHDQGEYLKQAEEFLKKKKSGAVHFPAGCPGSRMMEFSQAGDTSGSEEGTRTSQLCQWPIQLHLVSPMAPYFQGRDVVLSADCVAYALGDFHKDYLKGKSLAIGCPKLDSELQIYKEKIIALIDQAKINTLIVMTMEVPCCAGLLSLAQSAAKEASRKIPIKHTKISIKGEVLKDEWV